MVTIRCGVNCTPRDAVGATMGPTASWATASQSGFSGAQVTVAGQPLNASCEVNDPTSAETPPPTATIGCGRHAAHSPATASAEPSSESRE